MKSSKFKDEYFVRVYDLSRSGKTKTKIAKCLGVKLTTLKRWLQDRPALMSAYKKGRGMYKDGGATFTDYLFQRLSRDAQKVWTKITRFDDEENGVRKIEALLSNFGKAMRQQLFIHALVMSSFNASEACRKVNLPYKTFLHWSRYDPDFMLLFDELQWHKGNFFEEALVNLVKDGDSPATIFANKTFNRKRGYADKLTHEITGEVTHKHSLTNLVDELGLDIEVRKKILEAMRAKGIAGHGPISALSGVKMLTKEEVNVSVEKTA